MGVGNLLGEAFKAAFGSKKNSATWLTGIKRAFFHQGLLLVSICRRLPDPFPGQEDNLRDVLKLVMEALEKGAKEDAETEIVKPLVDEKFEDAKNALCRYIVTNRISLRPIRGSQSQKYYNGESLDKDMDTARRNDENAFTTLGLVDVDLRKKIEEIRKMRTIGISIQYFPALTLPQWNPIHRDSSKFKLSDGYNAPVYLAKNIFKVEKGTSIEMVLHRLLQCTKFHKNLESLVIVKKPELYEHIPDKSRSRRKVASLFPLETVDKFVANPLILTIEFGANKMIYISNVGERPLPIEWTNIWVIGQNTSEQWLMVRTNDPSFTLYYYTTAEFYDMMKQYYRPGFSVPNAYGGPSLQIPMPEAHPTGQPYNPSPQLVYPVQGGPHPQRHDPRQTAPGFTPQVVTNPVHASRPVAPEAQGSNPRQPMPATNPSMPRADVGINPPRPSSGPSSSSTRPSTLTSSTLTVDSETSSQNTKLQIPGSAGASHHITGDMKTVGREKKAKAAGGGFWSRLFR